MNEPAKEVEGLRKTYPGGVEVAASTSLSGTGHHGHGNGDPGGSVTALTGANIEGWMAALTLLVMLGAIFLWLGRRAGRRLPTA